MKGSRCSVLYEGVIKLEKNFAVTLFGDVKFHPERVGHPMTSEY